MIPHFNGGHQPFYLEYFYGSYGEHDAGDRRRRSCATPTGVVSDATQPDRIRFYRDLLLPFGGLPLLAPLELLMAVPQLLASVIGASPYARMIRYQYTSVMIAPIVIAAIEGAHRLWRYQGRAALPDPVARWSGRTSRTSPGRRRRSATSTRSGSQSNAAPGERSSRPLRLVPDDASVTATYWLLPHLAAPRADLRLAEPVRGRLLGQRRRLPAARSVDDRLPRRRPPAASARRSARRARRPRSTVTRTRSSSTRTTSSSPNASAPALTIRRRSRAPDTLDCYPRRRP